MGEKEIRVRPLAGTWTMRAGDAVLAETRGAVELLEDGHAPVVYFPRADVAMDFLEPSDLVTHCPWKGAARHFHIVSPAGRIENAAWSYEAPLPGLDPIRARLAFYPGKTTVEKL